MKRDIFTRPVRMVSKYGNTAGHDPVDSGTFDFFGQQKRTRVSDLSSHTPPVTVQAYGEHRWPASSPIEKPNGESASLSGPAPDYAECWAKPISRGTK